MAEASRTQAMGQNEDTGSQPTVDAPFGHALAALGAERKEVVALTADLGKYTDMAPFRDAFPDRFFDVGMAEQNLIAVSAGLARTGHLPFCSTYGVFATRRAYDYIAIACAHSRVNVKIVAGLPGLTTGYGGTHQAIEDLGLMRLIPGLAVLDPCDATEIATATRAAAAWDGPVYMRLQRGTVPVIFGPEHRFTIGAARLVREGRRVGIISTGLMTARALEAAAMLAREGVDTGVLHVPTIKPFDAAAIVDFARQVDRLVTAENHVTSGGLASLVAEALFDAGVSKRLVRVGLPDRFIECGSVPFLQDRYGLTAAKLAAAARPD